MSFYDYNENYCRTYKAELNESNFSNDGTILTGVYSSFWNKYFSVSSSYKYSYFFGDSYSGNLFLSLDWEYNDVYHTELYRHYIPSGTTELCREWEDDGSGSDAVTCHQIYRTDDGNYFILNDYYGTAGNLSYLGTDGNVEGTWNTRVPSSGGYPYLNTSGSATVMGNYAYTISKPGGSSYPVTIQKISSTNTLITDVTLISSGSGDVYLTSTKDGYLSLLTNLGGYKIWIYDSDLNLINTIGGSSSSLNKSFEYYLYRLNTNLKCVNGLGYAYYYHSKDKCIYALDPESGTYHKTNITATTSNGCGVLIE